MGYKGPFLAAAFISLPPIFLPFAMQNREFPNDEVHIGSTMKVVLQNKRAMITYAYYGMTSVLLSTFQTCLSNRLMDVFDFKANQVAIYFFFFFAGALTCSIICALLSRKLDKGLTILASLFICSFSMLFIGPSAILHIPVRKSVVGVGLFFAGAYNSISNYTVSQALKFTSPYVQESEYGDLVNSVSALRPFASGIGLFIGPVLGGLLVKYLGFPHMAQIYSLFFLIFACIDLAIHLNARKSSENHHPYAHPNQQPEERNLLNSEQDEKIGPEL